MVDTFSGSVRELREVSLVRPVGGSGAHQRSRVPEGLEEGGRRPDVTQQEGGEEEGGARSSGKEGPETGQEDARVDGVN